MKYLQTEAFGSLSDRIDHDQVAQLVVKTQGGSKKAFEELYRLYFQKVYYAAYKYLQNEEEAVEVTQEVFFKVYTTIGTLKEPLAFHKWINTIAYNLSLNAKRNRNTRHNYIAETDFSALEETLYEENQEFLPDELLRSKEQKRQVLDAIQELTDAQRTSVVMRYFEGLSIPEIAEITKTETNTIYKRLFDAKQAMKKKIGIAEEGGLAMGVGAMPVLMQILNDDAAMVATPQLAQEVSVKLFEGLALTVGSGMVIGGKIATAAAAAGGAATGSATTVAGTAGATAGAGIAAGTAGIAASTNGAAVGTAAAGAGMAATGTATGTGTAAAATNAAAGTTAATGTAAGTAATGTTAATTTTAATGTTTAAAGTTTTAAGTAAAATATNSAVTLVGLKTAAAVAAVITAVAVGIAAVPDTHTEPQPFETTPTTQQAAEPEPAVIEQPAPRQPAPVADPTPEPEPAPAPDPAPTPVADPTPEPEPTAEPAPAEPIVEELPVYTVEVIEETIVEETPEPPTPEPAEPAQPVERSLSSEVETGEGVLSAD